MSRTERKFTARTGAFLLKIEHENRLNREISCYRKLFQHPSCSGKQMTGSFWRLNDRIIFTVIREVSVGIGCALKHTILMDLVFFSLEVQHSLSCKLIWHTGSCGLRVPDLVINTKFIIISLKDSFYISGF